MTDKPNSDSAWFYKILIMALSPVVLEHIFKGHQRLTFGIGIVGGVLIQHFIPPLGRTRHLYLLLGFSLALALLNALL